MRRPPPAVSSTLSRGSCEMSISLRRPLDIHLHQIDQIGAAGDEFRRRTCGDLAHRVGDVGRRAHTGS